MSDIRKYTEAETKLIEEESVKLSLASGLSKTESCNVVKRIYDKGRSLANDATKERESLRIGSISKRHSSFYHPPFRVGREQGRSVLDLKGHELCFFPEKEQAELYCDYLNESIIEAYGHINGEKIPGLTGGKTYSVTYRGKDEISVINDDGVDMGYSSCCFK